MVANLVVATFLVLAIVGSVFWIQKRATDARKGWNLVPVVVAAVDIAEGTTVTFDQISQRAIPEQFVTASVVKPEAASSVVNQVALVPILAGDPILWTHFSSKRR